MSKIHGILKNYSYKLQLTVAFAIILYFFRLFFYDPGSALFIFINELLIGWSAVFLVLYITELAALRKINPLSLVLSLGILNAMIFFFISFSGSIRSMLSDTGTDKLLQPDLIDSMIIFFYAYLLLCAAAFIFLVFRELYFYKQKKNVSTYFNTMIVFILLTAFTAVIKDGSLSYIHNTFLIISIILIIINSIKISWIAFIVKKEKIALLILSVVISVLFAVNLANSSSSSAHYKMLEIFSPSLEKFISVIMVYGVIYFSVLFFTTLFHLPTAEAFDRKAQEVSSLQYFSRLITQVLDFSDLAETVTEIAAKVCNSDASWIVWKEDYDLKTIAHKNIGYLDAGKITSYIFNEKRIENLDKTFTINLADGGNHMNLSDRFTSVAVSPLKAHNETRGCLLSVKKNEFIFDDEDINALDTYSDYASVAIENSRLLEESIEKERLEKELDVAREIQKNIVPAKNPVHPKLSISSVFIPAFEVGGDYYDFFELENEKMGFVIADVSGKGISAAFIMAETKGIFESLSKTIQKPREILIYANQILKRTLDRKNFVSAAYGLIDFEQEKLVIARAGHCPLILLRDGKVQNIRPRGLGLGLNYASFFADTLDEIEIDLKENDTLVLYTDGITEAKNTNFEDFGDAHFLKILAGNHDKSADELSNLVIKEITLFSQDSSQHDDITLVIFKWKHNSKTDGDTQWQSLTPQLQKKGT